MKTTNLAKRLAAALVCVSLFTAPVGAEDDDSNGHYDPFDPPGATTPIDVVAAVFLEVLEHTRTLPWIMIR